MRKEVNLRSRSMGRSWLQKRVVTRARGGRTHQL